MACFSNLAPVCTDNVNHILLADDQEHDVFFLRRAIKSAGLETRLHAVQDGEQAVDYLCGSNIYADRLRYPLPRLLVTDLKMPRFDGFELLAWLQARREFASLPKLVMSSSYHEGDLKRCVDLGATAFFTKPCAPDQLVEMVREWHRDWLVPHGSRGPLSAVPSAQPQFLEIG
jgi:CheY-like chemotaxis protein